MNGGQFTQADREEYVLLGQVIQNVLPEVLLNVPNGHMEQNGDFSWLAYKPGGHNIH